MQVFQWHQAAVLIGADGGKVGPRGFAPLVSDRPAAGALASVLAGEGRGFRIGGSGALEAGFGGFETLTGGSLGMPRRVVRSQRSWLTGFAVNADLFGIGPGVSVAVLGRLSHSLALYGALEGLCLGGNVNVLDGLRVDGQALALAVRRVEVLYATPAQLFGVVAAGISLPALRHVLIGGAAVDAGLRARLADLAQDADIHVFYGAAETSFITLGGSGVSVGHPYPGVELRLLDASGRVAQEGEIWVHSPYLFEGYAGENAGSLRGASGVDPGSLRGGSGGDGKRWLSIGEVGRMTPEGLVLRGRAGRMVTVADRNVFPEEIEGFLGALPGVGRVAVVARDDAVRGSVLVAFMMGDRGCETAILAAARAELGGMVAPRAIIWVTDWPELASGKTDLGALGARADPWR